MATQRPPHFAMAIDAILKNWTALQLAINHGSGGAHSSAIGSWMVEALVQWFSENQNLEAYEVAEFLEDVLNRELNLIVEDGSTDEVGSMIVDFYSICSTKPETEIIEKLRKLPKCDLSMCRKAADDDGEADVDEGDRQNVEKNLDAMDIDEDAEKTSRKSNVVVDEEGWCTIVSSRKKK